MEPTISIVIPALNESENLRRVLPRLPNVHEIILVDGHSVDRTIETALAIRPEIRAVRQSRRGKGNALACGFEVATGDVIVTFDADGSADPDEIPAFVNALRSGADYAKGTRFAAASDCGSDDITMVRRLGNLVLNSIANALFRTRFSDLCYGYNAFWRRILPILQLPSTQHSAENSDVMLWGDGFEIECVLSCRVAAAGLRVAEVPSRERSRLSGKTNLRTFADGARVLRTMLVERRASRPVVEVPVVDAAPAVVDSPDPLLAAHRRRPPDEPPPGEPPPGGHEYAGVPAREIGP